MRPLPHPCFPRPGASWPRLASLVLSCFACPGLHLLQKRGAGGKRHGKILPRLYPLLEFALPGLKMIDLAHHGVAVAANFVDPKLALPAVIAQGHHLHAFSSWRRLLPSTAAALEHDHGRRRRRPPGSETRSPIIRLMGKRPQLICGCTFSITTRFRPSFGFSINPPSPHCRQMHFPAWWARASTPNQRP